MYKHPEFSRHRVSSLLVCIVSIALSLALALARAQPSQAAPATAPTTRPTPDPTVPAPKQDTGKFMKMHESFLKRAQEGPVDLLFLGDSITAGWATRAADIWEQYYGKYRPANFGIGGDRTEQILWRITTGGELDNIRPRVVVLLIGTNNTSNSGKPSVEQIVAAEKLILETIRAKLPETKILLLAIFPRGPRTNSNGTVEDAEMRMTMVRALNAELAKLDDGKTVRFLDLTDKFLVDGKIPTQIMPDQLHPSAAGYKIWAEAMQPLLTEMMEQQ